MREPDTSSAVQVMTIHESKGLTFDAVILPDLGDNSLTTARNDIWAKKNQSREIAWVFDLPRKEIYEADETLRSYHAEREAEAAFENLCKLYVAMTRARCANYLITEPRGRTAKSNNFVKLLESALSAADPVKDSIGDRDVSILFETDLTTTSRSWYEERKLAAPPEPQSFPESKIDPALARTRVSRRTPSGSENVVVTAAQIFSSQGQASRDFGTLVHAIFEDIKWIDEMTIPILTEKWKGVSPVHDKALTEVQTSLASPEITKVFTLPQNSTQVWCEKSFEILLDNEWLSGIFDRVNFERDTDGNLISASIIDFKTDRIDQAEAEQLLSKKYRPQLETYSKILVHMTGLKQNKIRLFLVSTHLGRLIEL